MTTFAALRDALDEFLTGHLEGLENEQRVEALGWYCQGLGFEVEAKTALGLASAMSPQSVQATRQRMQRALQLGRFEHGEVFDRLQETKDSTTKWTWNDFRRAVAQVLLRWVGHCPTCLRTFDRFPGRRQIR